MSDWSSSFESASVAAMGVYDDVFVPRLFTPWARVLLDEIGLRPGEAVLDVACGPGSVTRLAAERLGPTGRVLGCDFSAAMLALARGKAMPSQAAPVEYAEAPADGLPVADESFNVAVCQQGLQFFPDRSAALDELYRVLRPGGRLGIAVWSAIDDSPVFLAMYDALREAIGGELADRYRAGPWGLPEPDDLRRLIAAAGFEDVHVELRTVDVAFEGGAAQFATTLAASGIAAEIEALRPEQRRKLSQAFEKRARRLSERGTLRSQTSSNLATARR
jgi:ubiquinone/menaquinone biosynthesis C-methylase UbiE